MKVVFLIMTRAEENHRCRDGMPIPRSPLDLKRSVRSWFSSTSHRLFRTGAVVIFSAMVISVALSGCQTNRVIPLTVLNAQIDTERVARPIFDSTVVVTARENPDIRVQWKLEESIRDTLKMVLKNANIFGRDSSKPFEIVIEVVDWSQPNWGPGMFPSTLNTHYVLFDGDKNVIVDEEIATGAHSNFYYFQAINRARVSAEVNVIKNVKQFVDVLRGLSRGSNSRESQPASPPGTKSPDSVSDEDSVELLRKLHKLHEEGIISDEEYFIKKRKILDRL